jgi:DNA-binding NarL/FixJ family response regulator
VSLTEWLPDWFKKLNKARALPTKRIRILGVSIAPEDRVSLDWLADQHDWELRCVCSAREAFHLAEQVHFDLILCDRYQPGHPWREVMEGLAVRAPRSCILLVSPVNDDYLWSDVLQQGGHNILVRPLREKAVLRSIDAAVHYISREASFCSQ